MRTLKSTPPASFMKHEHEDRLSRGQLVFIFAFPLTYPVLLFLLAGDWHWAEGWVFSVWFLALYFAILSYLLLRDRELLLERMRFPGSSLDQPWDRRLIPLVFLSYAAWIAIMPLDARRFHWSGDFPFAVQVLGWLVLVLSFVILYETYTENPFLSAMVRVQPERGQYTVSTGLYRYIRHPLYLGADLMVVGTPLLLGSWYGLIPAALMVAVIVVRIRGEERLLVAELPGYEEYTRKVRYRLLPHIW